MDSKGQSLPPWRRRPNCHCLRHYRKFATLRPVLFLGCMSISERRELKKSWLVHYFITSFFFFFITTHSSFQNSSEPHCHQAVLFLTKVTTVDIGEYTFIVRSVNGLAEGLFQVNMTYASGYKVQDVKSPASSGNRRHFATIYVNVIVLLLIHCYSRLN